MSLLLPFVPLLIAMLVLMAGSAFCSASEAALFYLSRDDRKRFAQGTRAQKRVEQLLSEPERLLTSILFWNLMINILYFAIASRIDAVLRTQNHSDVASSFTLATLFGLILFGEMLPKNLAVLWPQSLSAMVSLPITAAMNVLRPILPTFLMVNRISLRTLLPNFEREPYLELRDIERAISISTPDKTLAQQEELVLHQIVWLSEMEAEELMRPRMGLTLYSAPVTLDDLRANPPNCDYLLVTESDSEEIERAMPLAQLPNVSSTHLESACERVPYVPWCASGAATLDLLRSTRSGLAVVINELGETIGIVTLDDVMHALFANPAVRQTSRAAAQSIEPLGDDVYKVNGAITLRRLSKQLKFELPLVKSVTIAGMLQEYLERIPEPGDEVLWGNCRFTVIDSPRPGVLTATVERLRDEQLPGDTAANGGAI
ncbi:CNNM domain-containing protein [Aeoliella sp. SH292]|uniref:CNNM domain-containing protein n=1 Tax=Aeoliella sp. SH292 TaxID=3454464 RepID=UPI003F9D754E